MQYDQNFREFFIFPTMRTNYCEVSESLLRLFTPGDAQQLTAQYVKYRRLALGLSRRKLAEKTGIPESAIARFERTGQISFGRFLVLWAAVDNIDRLKFLWTREEPKYVMMSDFLKS